jgi:hypothetical protein
MTIHYDDPGERDGDDVPLPDQNSADELAEQLVSSFYGSRKLSPEEPRVPKVKLIRPLQPMRRGDGAPEEIKNFLEEMFSQPTRGAARELTPELKARINQIWRLALKIFKSDSAAKRWFHTPAMFSLSGAKPIDWLTSMQECDIVEGMLVKLYPVNGNADLP